MEKNQLTLQSKDLELLGESKAKKIQETFEPMVVMLNEFEEKYNEVITESQKKVTKGLIQKAKRLRLDVAKVRVETGKLKDKQKEYIKLEDKAIMGVHNIIVWAVKEKEDNLKKIEDYFEIQEQIRLQKLQEERVNLLLPYFEDARDKNLSIMDEDVFQAFLEQKKKDFEKTEEQRKEFEKIKDENEKLRLIEKQKQDKLNERAKLLQPYIVFIRDYNTMINLPDNEFEQKLAETKKGAELQWEFDRKERQRVADLEAKLKEKERAEQLQEEAKQKRLQDELNKGDEDKLNDLVSELKSLKTKYNFTSDKNKKMYVEFGILINKVVSHITK